MFSNFSGTMYSPCESLKICFFLSIILSVPFCKEQTRLPTKTFSEEWFVTYHDPGMTILHSFPFHIPTLLMCIRGKCVKDCPLISPFGYIFHQKVFSFFQHITPESVKRNMPHIATFLLQCVDSGFLLDGVPYIKD
jgi:hypothetical protein